MVAKHSGLHDVRYTDRDEILLNDRLPENISKAECKSKYDIVEIFHFQHCGYLVRRTILRAKIRSCD